MNQLLTVRGRFGAFTLETLSSVLPERLLLHMVYFSTGLRLTNQMSRTLVDKVA